MAGTDPRETPSQVKQKNGNRGKKKPRRVIEVEIDGPLWEPDRWYRAEFIRKKRLRCSPHTWARYVAAGLKVYYPGTRGGVVWSSDLDQYVKMPVDQLPPARKPKKPPACKKKES